MVRQQQEQIMYKESDIVYDNDKAWVFKDTNKRCYTVYLTGITHSTSDSSYALNEDGLSLAIARAEYLEKRYV